MPSIEVVDRTADEEPTHGLTAHGIIACRGIHVVRAVRHRLGLTVTHLSGDPVADGERVTCFECRAVLGL